jgi:hypothetical protein
MFFFGLFSTHIPYIVLSIFYLAGFGAFSVNALKVKSLEKPANDKVIYHSHTNSFQNISKENTCFFVDFIKKKSDIITDKIDSGHIFFETGQQFKLYEKPIAEYSYRLIFSLFSRPPPAV